MESKEKLMLSNNRRVNLTGLRIMVSFALILVMGVLGFGGSARAAVHYVSPSGSASWNESTNINTPCSLTTANANAVAGDTINLRGGIYNMHILPANSGTDASHRIIYVAYPGETPIIQNNAATYATYYNGILLRDRSYIKIDGIRVIRDTVMQHLLAITHGSSYNEIVNCIIDGNGSGGVRIWDGGITGGTPCTNNWIHNCTIANTGRVNSYCDDIGGFQLGVPSYDNHSNYNTFEDNVFYCGGHHNLETFTKYNVIRDNYFHHEGCMVAPNPPCPYGPDTNGMYGNRNIQIYDGHNEDKYNLLEGNKFGHAGPPPDDDGGDGMTITAPKNIVRYNEVYNSHNNGILLKIGAGSRADNNRIYSNTVWKNGRYQNTGPQWQGYGIRYYGSLTPAVDNVINNNLIYDNASGDILHRVSGEYNTEVDNIFENNWLNSDGDPLFVDTDLSDWTIQTPPDLNLQSGSGAIDNGTHLTVVNALDIGSGTTLIVDDALYFQDGTWGSSLSPVEPDWIAIGTVNNIVKISSIDYETNTIVLTNSISRYDEAPVWLYSNSSGERVLYGSAPDIGAYEYGQHADNNGYLVDVYPNPCRVFRGENSITFSGSLTTSDAIKIYDINGRLVNNSGSLSEATYQWNVGEVASGVYFFVVKSADGQRQTSGKIAIIR